MRWLVFRMGEEFAAIPKPPEAGGQPWGYTADNLRTVPLQDGEDEAASLAFHQKVDPTLKEYLGTAEADDFPADDSWYNARRCVGYDAGIAGQRKKVGGKVVATVDMDCARQMHGAALLAARDDCLAECRLALEKAQVTDDAAGEKTAKAAMRKLWTLDAAIPDALAKCATTGDLTKITLDTFA